MDRLVAIKILGLAAADPQVRARFDRELVITGRLSQHPLFVTVYGHGISASDRLVMPSPRRVAPVLTARKGS